MHVGHFAVSLIAKRIEPRLSLGTVTFASMFPDVLWCILMLAHIEHVRFKPGITVQAGMRAIDVLEAPDIIYSHSLVMGMVWAALLAAAYFSRRRYAPGAVVLCAAVLSHWVLDFTSHPPDMPLAPGIDTRLGLGLWNSIPGTVVAEGALWLASILLYLGATRAEGRAGIFVFWITILVLTLAWLNNISAPPPPDLSIIGISSLIYFSLMIASMYWINRLRSIVPEYHALKPGESHAD